MGELIAIVLGLLVGLSLGALGGGGSALAVPILVFVAGLQAQDATTASLLVVGVASAFGAVSHLRNGNVRLGAGLAFGLAGVVGSRFGLLVNQSLDENVLLLAFSALILFVATRMYRSVDTEPGPDNEPSLDTAVSSHRESEAMDDAASGARPRGVGTLERRSAGASLDLSASTAVKLAGAATVVGALTGMFGVGGGFAVVPALTLLLKFPAKHAIGTSLVVIVVNALIALAMRSGDLGFDWAVVAPFLATVTLGVVVGTRISKDIDADRLTRAFAGLLVVVAIYTVVSTVIGT